MKRRDFLLTVAAAPVAAAQASAAPLQAPKALKGRIKQGVTRGVFGRGNMSLEDCCREAARLGIKGFDLIGPADWPLLRKYGLAPSMYPLGPEARLPTPSTAQENHARLDASLRAAIDECRRERRPEHHHVFRQPSRDGRRRGRRQLRGVPQQRQGPRRGQRRDDRDGAAQQPSQPPRLYVRPYVLGRRRRSNASTRRA
jgi:hypothetical protein